MSLFQNLVDIATAPVKVVDALVVEPVADLARDVTDTFVR